MNKIQISNLDYETISFIITDTEDGIMIKFDGTIDMSYPQNTLDPYFDEIHNAVIAHGIKKVHFNFENLVYINSSGIKSVVKWIMNVVAIKDSPDVYHLNFIISRAHDWQSASLGFITNLCPSLIHVDKKEKENPTNEDGLTEIKF